MEDLPGHSAFRAITSHTSIDCLPPELLALIFEASVDSACDIFDALDAIAWSQVSRLWRNVALSKPYLWTSIDIHHGSAEELALRSSPLPMHITLVGPQAGWEISDKGKRALNKLQRYAIRVQKLHVSADAEVIAAISSSLQSTSLPLLTSLDLTSTWDAFIVEFKPVSLAPNLRRLRLDSVAVELGSCANLTHLYIDNNRGDFTGEELLSLLERSPRLQMFKLLFLHLDEEDLSDMAIGVELAHIGRLHLHDINLQFLEYLFGHIYIPSSAPLLGYDSCSHSVVTSRDTLNHDPLHSGQEFSLYIDHQTMKIHDGDQPAVFDISAVPVAPLIPLTSAFIDLTPIRVLTLRNFATEDPTPVDVWVNFCTHLPWLNRIQLEGSSGFTHNLLMALWPDSDAPSSSLSICPHLRDLHLDFNEYGIDTEPSGRFILKCLEAGARAGHAPLGMLSIRVANSLCLSTTDALRTLVNILVVKLWSTP